MTNTKGIAINTVGYTGIVTLSQYTKGKRFIVAQTHNAGGKPLFNFLADCLAGDFNIAKLDWPTKILLLNVDDGVISKASNTRFIHLLSNPEKVYSDSEGIVRYSFIIPQTIFAGTSFNAIGLYPDSATLNDFNDYAALCKIDTSKANISISSVLVLDWELHISNQ
jgi:hypothetical protein